MRDWAMEPCVRLRAGGLQRRVDFSTVWQTCCKAADEDEGSPKHRMWWELGSGMEYSTVSLERWRELACKREWKRIRTRGQLSLEGGVCFLCCAQPAAELNKHHHHAVNKNHIINLRVSTKRDCHNWSRSPGNLFHLFYKSELIRSQVCWFVGFFFLKIQCLRLNCILIVSRVVRYSKSSRLSMHIVFHCDSVHVYTSGLKQLPFLCYGCGRTTGLLGRPWPRLCKLNRVCKTAGHGVGYRRTEKAMTIQQKFKTAPWGIAAPHRWFRQNYMRNSWSPQVIELEHWRPLWTRLLSYETKPELGSRKALWLLMGTQIVQPAYN